MTDPNPQQPPSAARVPWKGPLHVGMGQYENLRAAYDTLGNYTLEAYSTECVEIIVAILNSHVDTAATLAAERAAHEETQRERDTANAALAAARIENAALQAEIAWIQQSIRDIIRSGASDALAALDAPPGGAAGTTRESE